MLNMDESRELIELDEPEPTVFCTYCFFTKSLYEFRECTCRFCVVGGCATPLFVVADIVSFIPQCIVNNVKLCLQ